MNKKTRLKKATKSDFNWFNNDSYLATKQFDALAWSDFLKDRLSKYLNVNGYAAFVVDENDEQLSAQSFCEEIQSGIVKLARRYSEQGFSDGEKIYGDTSFSPFWDTSHVIRNVWPLTLGDIEGIASPVESFLDYAENFSFVDLPSGLQQWSETTDLKVSQPEGFMDIPYDFVIRRGMKLNKNPSSNQGLINLRIDLSVSNDEILAEMAKLLKVYRAAISKTYCTKGYVTVEKSDVEKLFDYKVLPHFDLKLWAAYKGLELSDTLIAELLFGSNFDPKTFEEKQKKLHKKVFDYSYADSLESYARSLKA